MVTDSALVTCNVSLLVKHILVPAIAPAAIVGLYFTPVLLFGCLNRGLMAVAVVLISAVAAFVITGMNLRATIENRASSTWWLLSALILLLPLVLVLGPLG